MTCWCKLPSSGRASANISLLGLKFMIDRDGNQNVYTLKQRYLRIEFLSSTTIAPHCQHIPVTANFEMFLFGLIAYLGVTRQ